MRGGLGGGNVRYMLVKIVELLPHELSREMAGHLSHVARLCPQQQQQHLASEAKAKGRNILFVAMMAQSTDGGITALHLNRCSYLFTLFAPTNRSLRLTTVAISCSSTNGASAGKL